MKKLFCCPALELFHCLPLWKTVLFVSSRAFLLSTPTFLLSTLYKNSEATWKKATKCNKSLRHLQCQSDNSKNSVVSHWPNPLPRRKRDWIFHHVVAKPQVVKNKIPHESRVALPRVTNGEFYPIPFSPWWRTDIPILHTKFWISILHMWGIDIAWFNFSTVETISIPHTWGIDRAWLF